MLIEARLFVNLKTVDKRVDIILKLQTQAQTDT